MSITAHRSSVRFIHAPAPPEGTLMAYRGAAGGLMGLVIMPSREIEGRFAVQIDIATILILSLLCFVHSPRTPVCSYH